MAIWQWLIWEMTWMVDADCIVDELIKAEAGLAAYRTEQQKRRLRELAHPEEMPF
jgi:hypothetical protein